MGRSLQVTFVELKAKWQLILIIRSLVFEAEWSVRSTLTCGLYCYGLFGALTSWDYSTKSLQLIRAGRARSSHHWVSSVVIINVLVSIHSCKIQASSRLH